MNDAQLFALFGLPLIIAFLAALILVIFDGGAR